jgi:hypothetical protein
MRIKINEKLSVAIAHELRSLGHDAEHVYEEGLSGDSPTCASWATKRAFRTAAHSAEGARHSHAARRHP